jgi:hypothetical protein
MVLTVVVALAVSGCEVRPFGDDWSPTVCLGQKDRWAVCV